MECGQTAADGVLVVIPARYGSTRFPGKALADLGGRPLIVRVAANAERIAGAEVVVATDDTRIFDAVTDAGHRCVMTASHPSGTERVGEVAAGSEAEIIVNLQGDEPLLDPVDVTAVIGLLRERSDLDVTTCAHRFADPQLWTDPNAVKVLVDRSDRALYFSRAPIPGTFPGRDGDAASRALRHVGIYAFRRPALMRFLESRPGPLEQCEGLEQLRVLEDGGRIGVVRITGEPVGVDTPADLETVRTIWAAQRGRN